MPHQYSFLTVHSFSQAFHLFVSLFSLLGCLLLLSFSCTLCHLLLGQGSRRERDWDSPLGESSSLVRQTWAKYQAPIHKNISLDNCTSNLPFARATYSLITRTIICVSSYCIMGMKISIAVICLFSFSKKMVSAFIYNHDTRLTLPTISKVSDCH